MQRLLAELVGDPVELNRAGSAASLAAAGRQPGEVLLVFGAGNWGTCELAERFAVTDVLRANGAQNRVDAGHMRQVWCMHLTKVFGFDDRL